jgi:hypothetical protein
VFEWQMWRCKTPARVSVEEVVAGPVGHGGLRLGQEKPPVDFLGAASGNF